MRCLFIKSLNFNETYLIVVGYDGYNLINKQSEGRKEVNIWKQFWKQEM